MIFPNYSLKFYIVSILLVCTLSISDFGSPGSSSDCYYGEGLEPGHRDGGSWVSNSCVNNSKNCATYDKKTHKCKECNLLFVLSEEDDGQVTKCYFAIQLVIPLIVIVLIIGILIVCLIYDTYFEKPERTKEAVSVQKELEGKPYQNIKPQFIVDMKKDNSI